MGKYQTKAKFIFTYNKENIIDRDMSLIHIQSSVLKPQIQSKIGSLLKYKPQLP